MSFRVIPSNILVSIDRGWHHVLTHSLAVNPNDKFCAAWSNSCGDMAVFDFSRWWLSTILDFQKLGNFNCPYPSGGQNAPSCQILCRSVKALRRYGRFRFFKITAVRHLGFVIRLFGPPTKYILVVSVTV